MITALHASMFLAGFEAARKEHKRLPTDREIAKLIGWTIRQVKSARQSFGLIASK